MKIGQLRFPIQFRQDIADKFTKLGEVDFSLEYFTADFSLIILAELSKFAFGVPGWVLAISSKYFRFIFETF